MFNPLDKMNLAESIANAALAARPSALPPDEPIQGAGVYLIYYLGAHPAYVVLARANVNECRLPIYVGKAIPAGGRKGGFDCGTQKTYALFNRLCEHAESIKQSDNLDIRDFRCRYVVVDDIWIPLGEQLLIERFSPVWNRVLDGFGNHDPGSGRYKQQRSPWDTSHPGRAWAEKCQPNPRPAAEWLKTVTEFLRERHEGAAAK